MASPDPAVVQSLILAWTHQQANYKFQTASYALYCYDHLLVFSDEVDRIWRGRFTFASLLYILNRYLTHVQFIAIQAGFYEKNWTPEQCDRFVKYPGASTTTVFGIAEMTMILRMYALYGKNKWILGFLSLVLTAQVTIMGVCLSTGVRVPFPLGFPGCVLTGTVSFFGAFWAAPLVTDTCIFALTLFRIIGYRRLQVKIPLMEQIFRDGVLYFFIIFCGNLLNVLLFWTAPADLTALGASFTHVMTSLMVCRLQLNLRKGRRDDGVYGGGGHLREPSSASANQTFFTIGNLGGDMQSWSTDSEGRRSRKSVDDRHHVRHSVGPVVRPRAVEYNSYTRPWNSPNLNMPLRSLDPFSPDK
ncbi:hypothetical protein EXIGLDRAFT_638154 [Exidia glandulosa HHB12029]|uniref:DUF6533 domain-containing protein n=1 Tax=Exidia glandulosa HHB12029 TaxID=1314781 RepID=A0A165P4Q4_EXIGL|nr:hypothetical protein EXIGLDRAFT_638154 [Exidia glandulosa HHB12029]